ncbi:MAG: DUF3726 domain-containing protein [Campylobacteraceae bacterium]|nr:DUF3726 domain-containing protein [Campylobacteraceae bacterium]
MKLINNLALRESSDVMNLKRMGAMHQSRISFTRTLVRKMANENWIVKKSLWDLCENGYGTVIYELKTPNSIYNLVVFSNYIEDHERNDRVIAEKWDVTFTLIDGEVSSKLLKMLKDNVPLQEAGRNTNRAMVLARANKSVRVFNHIVESLACGKQPDCDELSKVGYILRTTAVYGSGKFGITDFDNLKDKVDFSQSFSAEMCAVYILRQFSLDLVNYLAKNKGKDKSVTLDKNIQRYLGIGNATGLGMAPYLIKHPKVVDNWLYQRESALSQVSLEKITKEKIKEIKKYLYRAKQHLNEVITINENQKKLNIIAANEIDSIIEIIENSLVSNNIWAKIIKEIKVFSYEAQECTISSLIELFPSLVDEYANKMTIDEQALELTDISLSDLKTILREKYSWAINIDFTKDDNNYWFWYVSQDKEEPRLGIRNVDNGSELEQPLDIARQANKLYNKIKDMNNEDTISKFLLLNPEFTSITRRVWTMGHCVMGEIQANVLAKDFLPMDLLRAKLAMFGATKFDPRSDRWVQVTFYQSAPLLDEIHANEWLFPLLEKNKDDKLDFNDNKICVSQTELKTLCAKAFNGLKLKAGEADVIAKMVVELELVGLRGVDHFIEALDHLKDDNALSVSIASSENKISVDLGSCSILCHLQIVLAYAIEHMKNNDYVLLEIKNCYNKWLSYTQLKRLSSKELNAKFYWTSSSDNKSIEYSINKNEEYPNVKISNKSLFEKNTLIIEISKNKITNDSFDLEYEKIKSITLKDSYNNSLDSGILLEKDSWNKIKEVAKGILVESSEKSKNDAGGVVTL